MMTPVIEGGDIVEPLGDRVLGRVVQKTWFIPGTEEVSRLERGHACWMKKQLVIRLRRVRYRRS